MQFCSDHSQSLREPVHGLGYLPPRLAVLTWPRTLWGPSVAEARRLPAVLRGALEQAAESGLLRVQMVPGAPRNRSETELSLYLFPHRKAWRGIPPDQAASLIRQASVADGDAITGGQAYQKQLVLCCTDAKVDACCAKFGRALSRELQRQTADDDSIEVMETTHVGGCRLAASCIVMPQRARYSRMSPAQVAAFLQALRAGHIYPPCYRGNPDEDELQQVVLAEAAMWAHRRGQRGVPHQPVVDYADDAHARCRVRLDLEGGQRTLVLQVECQNRDYIIYSNCADMAEGISRPFPRWVAQPAQVLS